MMMDRHWCNLYLDWLAEECNRQVVILVFLYVYALFLLLLHIYMVVKLMPKF